MRSYGAARFYFSVLAFLSWCVIILGGIVAFGALAAVGQVSRSFGGSSMAGIAGLLPGIVVMFSGFLGLVFVQIGRAGVDSAEYAQQGLKIARDQLEVSRQALQQGKTLETSFQALSARQTNEASGRASFSNQPAPSEASPPAVTPTVDTNAIIYRGQEIRNENRKFMVGNNVFFTLASAEQYIDSMQSVAAPKLDGVTRGA